MRFLRRSAPVGAPTTDASSTDPAESSRAGKGRPTPKRREAETKRRGPAPAPPRTQREAAKLARANRPDREQRRAQATERRARMAAGDDKYLLPRDRGPVKAYIRDLVDSRPHLIGLFMPLAIIVVASLLLPPQLAMIQSYVSLFSVVMLAAMVIEGVYLGNVVTRKARVKFPEETIGALGTGWYAFTRASQLRRLRIPKPRVARGANP